MAILIARFRFNLLTVYWFAKVNVDLIKAFFLRNTLIAIIFFIQWILGNLIWYYIALMNWGWISWFARAYLIFLYSPLAMEKVVYILVAIWLSKLFTKKKKGEW